MFEILSENLLLQQVANDKASAIAHIAKRLQELGYVEEGYAQAMMAREEQTCTYLGNGIAIPHGTLESRPLVKKTGVVIAQFPQGVAWSPNEKAFIVIGIAAKSEEHLTLLRKLTGLLSDEQRIQRLILARTPTDFIHYFQTSKPSITPALITTHLTTDNLLTLTAENVCHLQQQGYCNEHFLSDVMAHQSLYLGENCFLNDSAIGNLENGISIAKSETGKMLFTVAQIDEQLNPLLCALTPQILQQLQRADKNEMITILEKLYKGEPLVETGDGMLEGTFLIKNPQGLHARPATLLVKIAKQFPCEILIANPDNGTDFVNGKNLMKVLTLGMQKNQHLHIKTKGEQAAEALQALEAAINDGLGE
ncbi:hypothetical protein A6A19_06360 [Actinobacillus delphinicola]|uniref:fused PTS fructose transporter subunit IIA/HPr protein n=1 Tax=Actinobacillus delphinicola TaxID=51161 RepID=UPI0024425D92|nr:fused PTS fructose transporter subunit IIA/HPr protein [Actinobacillus delphinicola]MDG6897611.1 hypothetical protein [Actinobacillus delphinicola]